jgi:hypothetical protein
LITRGTSTDYTFISRFDSNLRLNMITYRTIFSLLLFPLVATGGNASAGVIWYEEGDAGDSLATANVTMGAGELDTIVGTLPDDDPHGVDLYKLKIANPSLFSATTDNFPLTELLDTWLYLFDENGFGVAASASTAGGSPNATISLGSVSGPGGTYYLAVTRFESVPNSDSGAIFPDLALLPLDGEVVGPTGVGGSEPLSFWTSPPPPLFDFENYQIDLTGAAPAVSDVTVVPEPSSLLVWAPLALAYVRRRRVRE